MKRILNETDWAQLSLPDEIVSIDGRAPDPTKLFDRLQNAKFSPEFWNGLTAEQAIRMDFKSFSIPAASVDSSAATSSLGLGSILLEMDHYCSAHKDTLAETMARVMDEDQSELLGLLFNTFGSGDQRRRQIALASYDKATLDDLVEHLITETNLDIEVLPRDDGKINGNDLYIVRMEQGNITSSRKQVAPILMEYFKKQRG